MNLMDKLRLVDITENAICSSEEDAQKVFRILRNRIGDGNKVLLSFEGVEVVPSCFLNVAIGQLYGHFTEEKIKESLNVESIEQQNIETLKRVTDNAKVYFRRQQAQN